MNNIQMPKKVKPPVGSSRKEREVKPIFYKSIHDEGWITDVNVAKFNFDVEIKNHVGIIRSIQLIQDSGNPIPIPYSQVSTRKKPADAL
jgi:hypothetical protein